jgi:Uma2 family endonuclease
VWQATVRTPPVRTRRFTRAEYDRLVDRGFFDEDEPIELLDGLLVVKEPQGARHVAAVGLVRKALERAFGPRHHVRDAKPVALDDASEPEPDLAVVKGRIREYADAHPSAPVLVVEVSQASLGTDRRRKARLYARAGLREYWIVNLVDDLLEVYRDPVRAGAGRWKYRAVRLLGPAARVSPLAAPGARIRVADLLP